MQGRSPLGSARRIVSPFALPISRHNVSRVDLNHSAIPRPNRAKRSRLHCDPANEAPAIAQPDQIRMTVVPRIIRAGPTLGHDPFSLTNKTALVPFAGALRALHFRRPGARLAFADVVRLPAFNLDHFSNMVMVPGVVTSACPRKLLP
jgi:hypothetical protein